MHAMRYCINPDILWPQHTQKIDTQALREQFFKHLEEIALDEQRRHITFAVGVFWILDWGLHLAGVLRAQSTISLEGCPKLICCQFVLYTMIEAARRVYREQGWEALDPWQVFGLGDNLDLDHFLPKAFFEVMTRKGILTALNPDPNTVIA